MAVTGLGLVTPAGIGVADTWAAVCAGRACVAIDPELVDSPVRLSARVPDFDGEELLGGRAAHRLDIFAQFAVVAAREALADAGLDPMTWDGARVGVVAGSCHGGCATWEREHRMLLEHGAEELSPLFLPRQLLNMVAAQVAIDCGARGPNLAVTTASASGATAVGTARDLLLLDRCDVVLAGAAEAPVTPLTVAGYARMGALSRRHREPASASRPFDADRDGFVVGEGAGMLVLERTVDARARGARVRALLVGYGTTDDAHHVTAPDPTGRGMTAAVQAALADAEATAFDVGHINAHGTSTPTNDVLESGIIERLFPHRPVVTSTKGTTGHLLGAAGAVEAALTVLAVQEGVVPPTAHLEQLDPAVRIDVATHRVARPIALALTHSMGFGGHNAVLAVARA